MLAATTLGVVIWAVHFLGMVALQFPVAMTYNKILTIFTIIPAIISSFIAFYYINQPRHMWSRVIVSEFFIGTGIAVMHYVVMYVMKFEGATYSYHYGRVACSTLKIDKSFVDGILVSEKDKDILEAIVALGESLHMQLVIEGVEEQVDYLITLSEHLLIQGYYYAKPMKPEEF